MKTFVGLWVPARVSPERTSNLERGLSVGLVVSTKLFTVPICSNDKCPFGVYLVYIFGSKFDTTFMIVMI